MKILKLLTVLLLFAIGTWASPSLHDEGEPKKIATVEGITEYRLDNGLKVLLFPDPTKQTITVNVTYLVGSKHENYGETGMAHLLEHMLFKSTKKYADIKEEISKRGNRWNGTTWLDRTNYFETFPATEDNLDAILEMEADRMVNSNISAEELETEMTVVRNEFEMGENNPVGVLLKRVISTAYDWHNYGKSTIGSRSDIENVPIERLQAFYKKYYQPDNAVLIVTGKIEEKEALALVEKHFSPIPKPERVLPEIYTKDPTKDGERFVKLKRTGAIKVSMVAYHVPAGYHQDYAGIDIVSRILTNQPSGRLYKALVETKIATQIGGLNLQMAEPGLSGYFVLGLEDANIDSLKEQLLLSIDNLVDQPPTEAEVKRAKTSLLKNIEQSLNSSEDICIQLSNWIGMGDWRLFFLNRDRIENISYAEVQEVARTYFKEDNRTVGVFIPTENPDRVEIPEAPEIEELVKNYKGKENIAQGEAFAPTIENIEANTSRNVLGNGMKLALLTKKTRGQNIHINLNLLNGRLDDLKGKSTISSLTAGMLDKGTSKMNREDLKDTLDNLKASVSISGSNQLLSVSIQCSRPNLNSTLELVAEILKTPAFPAHEFDKLKRERISIIESQKTEPQFKAIKSIQAYLTPYPKDDPRYVPNFDEEIQWITEVELDEVKKFHKDFYGASHARLSMVGDFDLAETQKLLEKLFGNWESPLAYEEIQNELSELPIFNQNIQTPDKANAFFFGIQQFDFDPESKDNPALELGFFMLGTGFQSRLVKRIREKEGLSYGVGGNFSSSPSSKIGTFASFAIYAPENVEKLEKAFKEEIEKVTSEGFSEEEVEEAKTAWKQMRDVNQLNQDDFISRHLNQYLGYERDLFWDKKLADNISKLNSSKVNQAMRKYLDANKVHMVKAGDFLKSQKDLENR
ncbi:MAG: pitrilysin family protein [Bacteroidia bacterium]|nr:pitrilysin family protein [Bacteroidia bacterium]